MNHQSPPLTPVTITNPNNTCNPTTFIQTDPSSFKQVVQLLTGKQPTRTDPVPRTHFKKPSKLYERRTISRGFKISPLTNSSGGVFSPEVLSPSVLDFPALVLSPVTPLLHDPFCYLDREAEEKAIKEKGFYLHKSPVGTPRGETEQPRLLPLFPMTSPRDEKSSSSIFIGSDEFPLPEQLPTAYEDKFSLLIQSDATIKKIALLLKTVCINHLDIQGSRSYLREHQVVSELEFEDSYEAPTTNAATGSASEATATNKGRTVALDMQKRKNDVKARTTLLLALPDEHQLRFSKYKTAQELWAAIIKTFGGNEATKKTKKNLLKQQYGNFKAEGSETLEQTFNRLQAIVSHLQFMDIEIEQDDLNQKSDLDTMSLDDLYNHLKVYESKVQKKSKSNLQNIAFISSAKSSSGKEDVNTASIPTDSTNVSPASVNIGAKKISIQRTDVAGFDKSKVECFNCHKMGYFARECRAPRSQDRGMRDNYRQGSKVEKQAPKALMAIDGVGWDWSFMANEEEDHALVVVEEAHTEFALMAKTNAESEVFDNSLCSKICKKNTESLNSKITDLTDKLCDCKNMLFHYKAGLSQVEGLPEFTDGTITNYTRPSPSVESNPNDFKKSSSSASENGESTGGILSKPEIRFVRPADSPTEVKTDKKETARKSTVKYAELYRKPSKKYTVRGNQRNWNNLKSQQLGKNFVMKKACYNCGGVDHLHKSMSPRPAIHRPYKPPMRPVRPNMNVA
nr:hypothetical protein [Tanacetum cinerariifolium]